MSERVLAGELSVATELFRFVEDEALPGSGVEAADFWAGASALIHDLASRNQELLDRRDELQKQIDRYHRTSPGRPEPAAYQAFLREIGYLVEEPADFHITTT
jgi:malate synthase